MRQSKKSHSDTSSSGVRIDKWLWAARFFKTRSIAKTAVENGKVKIEGARIKASRTVPLGATLEIQQGDTLKTVIVTRLEERRKSATEAAKLYQETEESIAARAAATLLRKSAAAAAPRPEKRPSKKERRQIIQFNQGP